MIELRYMTENRTGKLVPVVDEVCADACSVHLEDMGDSWVLIVRKGDASIFLHLPKSAGKRGDAVLVEAFGVRVTKDGKEVAQ